ncbi:MAG: type II secretion system GspH family protein [Clostridia bacterium]|nr:type II secretion system GspH family protein [Clostridia bacterium]
MLLRKTNKGFTLYELTIVLAIIAIVVALLVSFIVFVTNYQDKVKVYNNTMEEIYSFKAISEKWFSHFDTGDYGFEVTDSDGDDVYDKLTANCSGSGKTDFSVYLSEDCIYFEFEYEGSYGTEDASGNYNLVTISTEYITSLSFEKSTSAELYKCTVASSSGDVTFLLERHVEV